MSAEMGVAAGVEAFLSPYSPDVRRIALTLRQLVLELVPGAIEQIDPPAKMLAYGFARTYKDTVCTIMPQKTYVNLGFPRGADMTDTSGLLIGTGKRARHIRIHDLALVGLPAVRDMIAKAAQLAKR
jgi:hypothetical protein